MQDILAANNARARDKLLEEMLPETHHRYLSHNKSGAAAANVAVPLRKDVLV